MIVEKAALAAGAFAASLMGGVGLGSYTLGGFRAYQPVDIIAEMASDRHGEAFTPNPLPQAPIAHVCKGCDAKLYRDVDYEAEQSYLADEESMPEDDGRWTIADDPVVDGSLGASYGSLSAHEAPAVVIIAADKPAG